MNFFRYFPRTFYKFGDESNTAVFEDLSVYSDMIDQVKDKVTLYQDYYILPDERPDQVSMKLYGTPDYHWTFFLMNDSLRESGWPYSDGALYLFAQKKYDHTVLTTRTRIYDKFKIGQTMNGLTSGASGVIVHRDLQLGQLWIEGIPNPAFSNGETIISTNTEGAVESIILTSSEIQYNAVHHYENASNEWVDIGFESNGDYSDPGGLLTPITWLDKLSAENDALKQIKVVRPNSIEVVAESFRTAVGF